MNQRVIHRAASTATMIHRGARRERGAVLFVALIALVVISLAALSLTRSADTAGVIAGNMAFKAATTHAADTGVERAFSALPALAIADADVANTYFRLMQPVDATGVPTTINWSNVPCYDASGGTATISCSNSSLYRVQYVIDRLCTIAPLAGDTLTQLTSKCVGGQAFSIGGKAGNDTDSHAQTTNVFGSITPPPPSPPTIHYRITVRVQGPRNAASIVQTTIEYPFT